MRISDWSSDVCSSDLRRFAYDSYRRFIQMFGDVVLEVDHHHFEEILELAKEDRGYLLDTEMTAEDWLKVIETYKAKVLEETGKPFPQDPKDQIWAAIGAVFGSWMNQRAITYRRLHSIPAERSEEHTSELQSLMRISYAVFCLKKTKT